MRKLKSFQCNKCSETYEKLVEENRLAPCPYCESQDVVSIFTPPAIKVTGAGAYTQKMKV